MLSFVLCMLFFGGGFDPTSLDGFREDYMRGVQAFRDGDMETFYTATAAAYKQNPQHVGVQFNLAVASVQTARLESGLKLLENLAEKGLVMPLDSPWLKPLYEDQGLAEAVAKVEQLFAVNRAPMLKSKVVLSLPRKDFFAEGIAYDPRTRSVYVGSVHHREIVRFDNEGKVETFISSGRDGLMSVLGMTVDSVKRLLWVCSSGLKQTRDLDITKQDTAELLAFHLDSGALVQRIAVPKQERNNLNDLVRHNDGTLFLSDATSGAIYRLAPGASALELVLDHGSFRSPQGLALNSNGTDLFIADYSHGLFKLHIKTGALIHMKTPSNLVLAGIDGLVAYRDRLIVIQNGVRPHRVLMLELKDHGQEVASAAVLERSHPKFDEPTLGMIHGDQLWFVAASQWPHYDAEGKPLASDALRQPEILALDL